MEKDEDEPKESGKAGQALPADVRAALSAEGLNLQDPKLVGILISLMRFQGSLQYPPAEILDGWERLYPGITRKLVEQTDRQTAHRHNLEKLRANRSENRADRGQLIMAGIAFLGLGLSAGVGIFGNPVVASILAIVSIGGPTSAALLAHRMGWSNKN